MLMKLIVDVNKTLLIFILCILLPLFTTAQDSINTKNRVNDKSQFSIEGQLYLNFNLDVYRPQLKLRIHLHIKSRL